MSNYTVTSTLLQGLGKPTRRGVKKCLQCGVYNGTRGIFCKNKECGVPLKIHEYQDFDIDAVKLITGTFRQVYSVRVKDSSTTRGFVQLPLLHSNTEDSIRSDVALCFVDSCQRSFDNSILKCHEENQINIETEMCEHISIALKNEILAKPVQFDRGILNYLKIPNEITEKLDLLASDKESPLVQRVSKDVMAVKCQVTPKQPMGYLHFTFFKGKNKGYEKYNCNCTEYLISALKSDCKNIRYKCIHYYACIAALSTDPEYSEEFSHFINNERGKSSTFACPKIIQQIEPIEVSKRKVNVLASRVVKKATESKKEIPNSSSIKKQKYIIKRCKKIVPKIYPIEIKVLNESALTKSHDVSWHFMDWLSFVTESINDTMQFTNYGIVNTQIFYVPEAFFHTFKERIPESYLDQKTDMGTIFYTIMNVNHVKEIFDTSKVKLRIAKKFIHHENRGYVEYDERSDNDESQSQYQSSFIFFLNVGQSTVDESDNCNNPFIIEWFPNIYSSMKIGQLKVQYKYGRKSI